MESPQLRTIVQLVDRLSLSEGEVRLLAAQITGGEIVSLFDLSRQQADQLISTLDSLAAAPQ